jgi:hypothetical protein
MSKKSGEETELLLHFSKTDFRYWSENVFRKAYTKNGRWLYTKDWYARIQHDGRREFFPLRPGASEELFQLFATGQRVIGPRPKINNPISNFKRAHTWRNFGSPNQMKRTAQKKVQL